MSIDLSKKLEKTYKVDLHPHPQGRPRVTVRGGRPIVYDPPESKQFKEDLKRCIREQGVVFFYGAVELTVRFRLKKPKALPEGEDIYHITRPDLSNLLKSVEDALSDLVLPDDKHIARVVMEKFYSDKPGIEITIKHL